MNRKHSDNSCKMFAARFGFFIFMFVCWMSSVAGEAGQLTGMSCNSTSDCTVEYSTCINEMCTCNDGTEMVEMSCIPVISSGCYGDQDCPTENSVCIDSSCTCDQGYVEVDLLCLNVSSDNDTITDFDLGTVRLSVDQDYIGGQHTVVMECNATAYDGLLYRVFWQINNSTFTETGLMTKSQYESYRLLDSNFTLEVLSGLSFDTELGCSVAVYDEHEGHLQTQESDAFRPVNISTNQITIQRGSSADFTVTLYLPFGCSSDICYLDIQVFDPDAVDDGTETTIAVVGTSNTCGGRIVGATPATFASHSTVGTEVTISLMAINHERRVRSSFSLSIRTVVTGTAKPIWSLLNAPSVIAVTVVGDLYWGPYYRCYMAIDPHMRSFDGRYYENQNVETFVLMRHKYLPIEVQSQTKPCNYGWATCSCSMTLRVGGDVFSIQRCNGAIFTGYLNTDSGGSVIRVYQLSSTMYQIIIPTGTIIQVYEFPRYWDTMNIVIYPSPSDIGNIEGLCGNLDGDPTNDLTIRGTSTQDTATGVWYWFWLMLYPNDFSMSWGIDNANYAHEDLWNNYNSVSDWPVNRTLCACHTGSTLPLCSYREDETNSSPLSRRGRLLNPSIARRDANTPDFDIISRRRVEHIVTSMTKSHKIEKRQLDDNAITFEEARDLCAAQFNSCSAINATRNMSSDAVEKQLNECALDVMIDGDQTLSSPHCDAYTQQLVVVVSVDEEFAQNNPEVVVVVESSSCLGNCNGNGSCINGTCHCNAGYGNDLCLIELARKIGILPQAGGDVCDLSSSDTCDFILIVGDGFVENATCNVIIFTANSSGIFVEDTNHTAPCVFVGIYEVYAPLPTSRRRRSTHNVTETLGERVAVTVSNDGVTFSDPQYVYVLDSTCQEVVGEILVLKAGYCYIQGTCYSAGALNDSSDACTQCQPTVEPFDWSDACRPETDDSEDITLIIAVVCGVVGGLLVIAAGGLFVWHFKIKNNARVGPSDDISKNQRTRKISLVSVSWSESPMEEEKLMKN